MNLKIGDLYESKYLDDGTCWKLINIILSNKRTIVTLLKIDGKDDESTSFTVDLVLEALSDHHNRID